MVATSAPPLFFLRHGETFFNAEGRIQGRLDIPLAPRGRDQAAAAGRTLQQTLIARGLNFSDIACFASPLARAMETMAIARAAMGLDSDSFVRDDRLMELSFGRWENMTWPEIRKKDPKGVAAREKSVWSHAPPEGESYVDLVARVRPWLESLTAPTIIVAHGGVARALMTLRGGVETKRAPTMPVHQGRILVFENGRGRWL